MENETSGLRIPTDSLDNIDESLERAKSRVHELSARLSEIVSKHRGSHPAWKTTGLLVGLTSMTRVEFAF